MTEIICNGSKWYGEKPDSLATLAYRLKNYRLDKTFYGCCIYQNENGYKIFGNFLTLSAVFNIQTDNPTLIKYFRKLLALNIKNSSKLK